MRTYMRGRRVLAPELTIWQRAHRRAASKALPFAISVQSIVLPKKCPALGIPISLGERRSDNSPSLDRIVPEKGYVPGNVRVISDKANRLKGDRTLAQLETKALTGPDRFREDYRLIAEYVRREALVGEIQQRLSELGLTGSDQITIAGLLERLSGHSSAVDPELSNAERSELHMPSTQLTSQMIQDEFGLTKHQVLLLRRLHGFPRPVRKLDGFRFDRAEVEQWIATQPEPSQPAAVLKRPRRIIRVNSKAAARLLAQCEMFRPA